MICRVLKLSRQSAYRQPKPRPKFYQRRDDGRVLEQIGQVTQQRASYGYRRVTALINREIRSMPGGAGVPVVGAGYNVKRIRRLMRQHALQLPSGSRRRTGRAHTGKIAQSESDRRWCSDGLELHCWTGEKVQVAFALDCCDREVLAHVACIGSLAGVDIRALMRRAVAHRFGSSPTGGLRAEHPIEWLSDNGSMYTATETLITAERLNLVPITTPVCSPQSNGMSEALVNTIKRDYAECTALADGAEVLRLLPYWIDDYNTVAPHSALGMKSPVEFRQQRAEVEVEKSQFLLTNV